MKKQSLREVLSALGRKELSQLREESVESAEREVSAPAESRSAERRLAARALERAAAEAWEAWGHADDPELALLEPESGRGFGPAGLPDFGGVGLGSLVTQAVDAEVSDARFEALLSHWGRSSWAQAVTYLEWLEGADGRAAVAAFRAAKERARKRRWARARAAEA